MTKNTFKLILLLFSYIGFSQTYTVTQKPSYSPNTSTYEVKQKGTGAYENPKTYTPTTTSAQHLQNMQNNIVNSVSNVSSAMGGSLSRQMEADGMVKLENAIYRVTKVGSSGFVGLKKLNKKANEEIELFTKNINSKYEIIKTEEYSQSFGVLPKVIITFKLINEDGTLKLSREEIISENTKKLSELKKFLEIGVLNQEEYDAKAKVYKDALKKIIE